MFEELKEWLLTECPKEKKTSDLSEDFILRLHEKLESFPATRSTNHALHEYLATQKCKETYSVEYLKQVRQQIARRTLKTDIKHKILLNSGHNLVQHELWEKPKMDVFVKKKPQVSLDKLTKFYKEYEEHGTEKGKSGFQTLIKKYGKKEKKDAPPDINT